MIGRIKNLNEAGRSGFIQAENGQTVYFAGSAVWEHDFPFLTVGQAVSFDLQAGHWPKAANVHLFEGRSLHEPERSQGSVQLRYIGFEQNEYVRTFRFQAVMSGEQTRDYGVTVDLRMFQKHHVGIQEGPALCSRVLLAHLAAASNCGSQRNGAVLTEEDLVAHLASRTVPARKPFRRRARPVRPQMPRPANPI
jgi:cold shock CspA family protein